MPNDVNVDGAPSSNPTGAQPTDGVADPTQVVDPAATGVKPDADPNAPKGEEPKAGEKKEGEGPPAEYKFEVPEGMVLDEAAASEFSVLAKDMGLSQENAQKLVGLYAAQQAKAADAHAALVTSWTEQVKSDPAIGGEKLAENLAIAKRAIDLAPPEFKALLNETGYGNHPVFVKACIAWGKALSPDTVAKGDKPGDGSAKDPAKTMFPSMN